MNFIYFWLDNDIKYYQILVKLIGLAFDDLNFWLWDIDIDIDILHCVYIISLFFCQFIDLILRGIIEQRGL